MLASALAPAVGQPSKSAGCLAAKKKTKKNPALASTISRFCRVPSTTVRRGVIQKTESGSKMTFKVLTVHQLSPYVNPLDIVDRDTAV